MILNSKSSILIIGGGKAGSGLAYYFLKNHLKIISLIEKDLPRRLFLKEELHWKFIGHQYDPDQLLEAQIILLAVNDDQLTILIKDLASISDVWLKKTVLHLSGALSSRILYPLESKGASTGSLHPLFSFGSDPRENQDLKNCWFTLVGSQINPRDLEKTLAFTKNRIIAISDSQKQAVHIASVFYSNF